MSGPGDDEHAKAVGAAIAVDVARELAPPLGELRDRLALLVDTLDRHVALSTGPTPYPWAGLQELRQALAHAYLTCAGMSRLAGTLATALASVGAPIGVIDVNHEVEGAVHVASHRLAASTELLVDTGSVPPARGAPGELTLAVAQLVLVCAESAARVPGSSLSVRTRAEDDQVVVTVADNGGGAPAAAGPALAHVAAVVARAGGSCDGTSEDGHGSAFELRLPAAG
jgi:signal transduction histidine kinase